MTAPAALRFAAAPVLCASLALAAVPAGAEPVDLSGVPSREERLLLVFSNQVRQAPHDWPGWDTSLATGEARSPLSDHPGLTSAAGFHAEDMAANGFFSHDSSDGTSFPARVSRWFSGPAGENIFMATFGDAETAITAWMGSTTGHRENLLEPSWTYLGTGFASAPGGARLYVQDFGRTRGAEIPRIPAASWRVRGGSIELFANYFDPSRRGPSALRAAVGDRCVELEPIAGPPGNQTARATIEEPSGCEPVVFVAVGADGEQTEYPLAGSFLAGAACGAQEDDPQRRPSACGVGPGGRPVIDAEAGGCRCTGAPASAGSLAGLLLGAVVLLRGRRSRRGS